MGTTFEGRGAYFAQRFFVVFFIVSIATLPALAGDIKAGIDRVTVFPGLAQVTRTARITIPAKGEHTFTVRGIPQSADPSSIRLKGMASGAMKFGGIDMTPVYEEPDTGRIAEITERIKIIDDRLNALAQKRSALDIQKNYLASIGNIASQGATRELQAGKVDPLAYQKTLEFLDSGLMGIADRTVQFGIDERELRDEKSRLSKGFR